MTGRLTCIGIVCVVMVQGVPQGSRAQNAELPAVVLFETVLFETVLFEAGVDPDSWKGLPAGSALLLDDGAVSGDELRAFVDGAHAAGLHVLVSISAESAINAAVLRASGADGFVEDRSAFVADAPAELLAAEVDWEAAFASVSASVSPRVVRLRTEEITPDRMRRLLFLPAGLLLDAVPEDEVGRAATDFRLRHPAVGAGRHEQLVNSAYAFRRSLERAGRRDEVVVVFGASGATTVNVARAFPDDTLLRDALTGRTAFVSFGTARFEAHESGLILIEELP